MKKILLGLLLAIGYSGSMIAECILTSPPLPGKTRLVTNAASGDCSVKECIPTADTPEVMKAKERALSENETFQVTVISDADGNGKISQFFGVYFINLHDSELVWYTADLATEGSVQLPAGEYVMQAVYMKDETIFLPVTVSENTEIHLNPDMADQVITVELKMPDGQPVALKGGATPATVVDGALTASLSYKGLYALDFANVYLKGSIFREQCSFRSNLSDENGAIRFQFSGESVNNEAINIVIQKAVSEANEGIIVNNEDDYDYVRYTADLCHTPAFDKYGYDNESMMIGFNIVDESGYPKGGISYYMYTPPAGIYSCAAPSDDTGLLVRVGIGNVDIDSRDLGIQSPELNHTPDGFWYLATQGGDKYYWMPDIPTTGFYPANPAFSFMQEEGQILGSTSAVCVTYKDNRTWPSEFSYIAPSAYYGNYGELRNSDLFLATTTAEYNGEAVYDGSTNIFEWASAWAANGHTPGEMKYTFTDTNIMVDGIPGSNVCTVTYNEGNEDQTPPSVQRVMFRTADGKVTNRFNDASEAVVTLAGGDFIETTAPMDFGGYQSDYTILNYAPAIVEVAYAPYGESEFTSIEVVEDPDKFFMPGFGAYYEGSLAKVDRESANGWYDLKVAFTDEAGNTQSQVISPAFSIDRKSNVDSINASKESMFCRDGRIVAASGAEVIVFTSMGERVRNSGLTAGVYVARCGDSTAKIQVR